MRFFGKRASGFTDEGGGLECVVSGLPGHPGCRSMAKLLQTFEYPDHAALNRLSPIHPGQEDSPWIP